MTRQLSTENCNRPKSKELSLCERGKGHGGFRQRIDGCVRFSTRRFSQPLERNARIRRTTEKSSGRACRRSKHALPYSPPCSELRPYLVQSSFLPLETPGSYLQNHLNVPCFLHRPKFRAPQQHALEHVHPLTPRREEGVPHLGSLYVVRDDARDGTLRGEVGGHPCLGARAAVGERGGGGGGVGATSVKGKARTRARKEVCGEKQAQKKSA